MVPAVAALLFLGLALCLWREVAITDRKLSASEAKARALLEECARLRTQNFKMKAALKRNGIEIP